MFTDSATSQSLPAWFFEGPEGSKVLPLHVWDGSMVSMLLPRKVGAILWWRFGGPGDDDQPVLLISLSEEEAQAVADSTEMKILEPIRSRLNDNHAVVMTSNTHRKRRGVMPVTINREAPESEVLNDLFTASKGAYKWSRRHLAHLRRRLVFLQVDLAILRIAIRVGKAFGRSAPRLGSSFERRQTSARTVAAIFGSDSLIPSSIDMQHA